MGATLAPSSTHPLWVGGGTALSSTPSSSSSVCVVPPGLFMSVLHPQSSPAGRPSRCAIYFSSNCANCVVFAARMIIPLSRTIRLIVGVEGSWEKHGLCQ